MKRKLLALAVASACASPALAQVPAEIQVYGRVNVSVESIKVKNSTNTALPNDTTNELVDNSSRIGFRGNKDLGDGLKVLWQVESRVKLDDSAGSTFSSRDSYAGLQGGFGTIRAGRSIGPVYYATYDYISMHNHDTGTSSDNLLSGAIYGNAGFMNNLLWYTTPKFGGGFSADVAYSFGPTGSGEARAAGVSDQPSYIGLVGAYDAGGLHVAVSYASTQNTSALGGGQGNEDTAYTLGAAYNFKSFVLGGLVEKSESKQFTGSDADRTYWRISGMLPVGKNEFHLNYGNAADTKNVATTDNGAVQWTVAWNYNITPQTKVYAFYTTVDNDTNGTAGFRQTSPATAGADFTSLALGLRHNF